MLFLRVIPLVLSISLLSSLCQAKDLVISEQETETYTANPNCDKIKVSGKLTSAEKDHPLANPLTGRFRCSDANESYLVIERNGAKIVLKAKDSVVIPAEPKDLQTILFEVGIPLYSFSSVCENIKEKGKFLPRDVKGTVEQDDALVFRCESEKGERRAFYIFTYNGFHYLVSTDDVVIVSK